MDDLAAAMLPDKRAEIFVYCANLACENSKIAARRLSELGYTHVYDYAEGKQDWLAAGLPVEHHRDTSASVPAVGMTSDALPVACSLDEPGLMTRSETVLRDLFAGAVERRELKLGYAFRFPGDSEWDAKITEFLATERRCSSFFQIELPSASCEGASTRYAMATTRIRSVVVRSSSGDVHDNSGTDQRDDRTDDIEAVGSHHVPSSIVA